MVVVGELMGRRQHAPATRIEDNADEFDDADDVSIAGLLESARERVTGR